MSLLHTRTYRKAAGTLKTVFAIWVVYFEMAGESCPSHFNVLFAGAIFSVPAASGRSLLAAGIAEIKTHLMNCAIWF